MLSTCIYGNLLNAEFLYHVSYLFRFSNSTSGPVRPDFEMWSLYFIPCIGKEFAKHLQNKVLSFNNM